MAEIGLLCEVNVVRTYLTCEVLILQSNPLDPIPYSLTQPSTINHCLFEFELYFEEILYRLAHNWTSIFSRKGFIWNSNIK